MSDEIEKIVLNEEEFDRLMEILENPPEPTPLMRALIEMRVGLDESLSKLKLEGKGESNE